MIENSKKFHSGDDIRRLRSLLEDYEKSKAFPSKSSWHSVRLSTITNSTSSSQDNHNMSELEKIRNKELVELVRKKFDGNLYSALSTAYPEEVFQPWQFGPVPRDYFENTENQRAYLEWLGNKLGFRQPSDWSRLNKFHLREHKGRELLNLYKNSVVDILRSVFPEIDWQPWTMPKVSQGYWGDSKNMKEFLDWYKESRGFKSLEDFYDVTLADIMSAGAAGLLAKNKNSISQLVGAVYPEVDWLPWKFKVSPMNFWKDLKNQSVLDYEAMEDWYKVSYANFADNYGGGFLSYHYGSSAVLAVMTVYKNDYDWKPWLFNHAPVGWWHEVSNQRIFMDWLFVHLNLKSMDDWHSVSAKTYESNYGAFLIRLYEGSPYKMLRSVYPEIEWKPYAFDSSPKVYWTKDDNALKEFMDSSAAYFGVNDPEDWYRVSVVQLAKRGGRRLIQQNGGIHKVLSKLYPEVKWDKRRLSKTGAKKSSQRWLTTVVKRLFPGKEVLEDYDHPSLRFSGTQSPMQLDVFIPELKLAFEYQGKHHYVDTMVYGLSEMYRDRDKQKKEACKDAGITLFEVPHWWDETVASIQLLIHQVRPDLIESAPPDAEPIGDMPVSSIQMKTRKDRQLTVEE